MPGNKLINKLILPNKLTLPNKLILPKRIKRSPRNEKVERKLVAKHDPNYRRQVRLEPVQPFTIGGHKILRRKITADKWIMDKI